MKEKKNIRESDLVRNLIAYRPIAENSNSSLVDVFEVTEDGLTLIKVNERDSQLEIDKHATNLDVTSIIERYVQSDNPIELNAKNGVAINQEIEVEETQPDGSVQLKKIKYADASWVAPNDTFISIQEKLKKVKKTINQLNEEVAKVQEIKQVNNDSNKVIASDSTESTSAQE